MSFSLPQAEGFREATKDGAAFGLSLGLVECVAAYAVGTAPASDGLLIVGFDLVLGLLAGMALGIVAGLGTSALGQSRVRRVVLLSCVVVLFATRSGAGFEATPEGASRWKYWALSVGLLVLAGHAALHRVRSAKGFTRLATVAQAGAVLLLILHSVPFGPVHRMYTEGGWIKSVATLAGLLAGSVFVLGPALMRNKGQGWRTPSVLAAVGAFLLWLQAASGPTPSAPSIRDLSGVRPIQGAPNVVLIVLDTVRADRLLEPGRALSPNITAFASHASTFAFAHSTAPFTLASHASMFSGLLPSEHGARHVPFSPEGADVWLDASVPTLAKSLGARGYVTGGIIANAGYVGRRTGLASGFSEYSYPPLRQYRYVPLAIAAAFRFARRQMAEITAKSLDAGRITNQSMEWIRRRADRPFFLFVNYIDAHFPYRPPPPHGAALPGITAALRTRSADLSPSAYDGEITYLDSELGRLLSLLDHPAFAENTLVILTSDHGEGFGEHGCTLHDNSLYEELIHVPLVVRLPGQRKAYRSTDLVSLAGVPSIVDGVLSGLRDPDALNKRLAQTGPTVIAEHWFARTDTASCDSARRGPVMRAIFDDRWKLVQSIAREELYDLRLDPGETRDMFLVAPGDAKRRRDLMLAAGFPPLVDLARMDATGRGRIIPDEATREALRAVGYLR